MNLPLRAKREAKVALYQLTTSTEMRFLRVLFNLLPPVKRAAYRALGQATTLSKARGLSVLVNLLS